MGMTCTICSHEQRLEIDRAIVQGQSYTKIANDFGVGAQAVRSHAQNHLSRQLLKHTEIRERINSERILDEVEDILSKAKRILRDSEADNQRGVALNAIKEIRCTIEFLSKLAITLHQIQNEDRAHDTHEEDLARAERIKQLPTCELNLLGDLQAKIDGELPLGKPLLPKEFYDAEDSSSLSIPNSELPEDEGGVQTFTERLEDFDEFLEGLEGLDAVEPEPEPEPDPTPTTMVRRRPTGKVTYGPGMPKAQAKRIARQYIKEHGRWPSDPVLREALK
ncbi:MAG: hypothetical protein AVO38_10975 [delta proteobacterium ML8_D]|nr:MAG: hypothetical protein AVO34_05370 [Firmicutes bacterium ML8_F2]OPL15109.1 MAG: hypothetical protein AVO38_10975 [delta proteobacterium ML8_D]